MKLVDYIAILWRRKWIIVGVITVAMIVDVTVTFMTTPIYEASTMLRIATTSGRSAAYGDLLYADRLMNTYVKVAKSKPLLDEVAKQLNLKETPEASAEILAQTELLKLTVEHKSPVLAAESANALANALISYSRRLRGFGANNISIIDPATVPKRPATPRWSLNLALGLILSAAGGLGMAFLFEGLDTRLHTTKQIEMMTELNTLGRIPVVKHNKKMAKQLALIDGSSVQKEAFQRLQTNIFALNPEVLLRTLMITSPEPGEGKSTIVANLAYSFAQSGRKIIVIDCDLRLPTIHKKFGLENKMGLGNILRQEVGLADAVQNSAIPGVEVLTSGPLPPNPAELLGTPQMTSLIERAKQDFDLVLLDTPSLLAVSDAAILAPVVDGVALVIRRTHTRQEMVSAAFQQLVLIKANLVGVIVNQSELDHNYYYYHQTVDKYSSVDKSSQ